MSETHTVNDYGKKTCKTCWGRGYVMLELPFPPSPQLRAGGFVPAIIDNCPCIYRRHDKVKHEENVADLRRVVSEMWERIDHKRKARQAC